MKLSKFYVWAFWGILFLGSAVFAGRVSFQILDTDPRFQPINAFHKGCEQDTLISLGIKEKAVTKIHLLLHYDPNALEISRMTLPQGGAGNFKIEYDRVVIDQSAPTIKNGAVDLSHMTFKWTPDGTGITLQVSSGSYIVSNGKKIYLEENQQLPFAQVPECTPDMIPPSVKLVFPTTVSDPVTMDQYFIFDIKDSGKGIDKDSIKITFLGKTYTANSDALKWKGDYITFYPDVRLPVASKIDLNLVVGDKQTYGGANTTSKDITFQTASGMVFLDPMAPATFRQMARGAAKLFGSPDECTALRQWYVSANEAQKLSITPILNKLACSAESMSGAFAPPPQATAPVEKNEKAVSPVSAFAALGWFLFIITLILKLHYFVSYRKHKKLAEKYRKE